MYQPSRKIHLESSSAHMSALNSMAPPHRDSRQNSALKPEHHVSGLERFALRPTPAITTNLESGTARSIQQTASEEQRLGAVRLHNMESEAADSHDRRGSTISRTEPHHENCHAQYTAILQKNERLEEENEFLRLQVAEQCALTKDAEARAASAQLEASQAKAEKERLDSVCMQGENEIRQCMAELNSLLDDRDSRHAEIAEIRRNANLEISELQAQLSASQSKIFSLQPYRKEPLPEELGCEYDALVDSVCDWAQKFMAPLTLDKDPASLLRFEKSVRSLSSGAIRAKRFLTQSLEYRWALHWPETEEDIISSRIMSTLDHIIFGTRLYGDHTAQVQAIEAMEHSMQHDVQPARDLYSLRSWRADCFHSIIHSHEFRMSRDDIVERLATRLNNRLRLFCTEPDTESEFKTGFADHCIKPAMELHEKMMMSTNEYLLDQQTIITPSHENSTVPVDNSNAVLSDLTDFNCIDILHHRKEFNLDRMRQRPTRDELRKNFRAVCSIAPALMMRHADDTARPPEVIRKQRIVVAWGEDDLDRAKREFIERSDPPLLLQLVRR